MSTRLFAIYLIIAVVGVILVIVFAPAQAATERKPRIDWSAAQPDCKPKSKRIWCIK